MVRCATEIRGATASPKSHPQAEQGRFYKECVEFQTPRHRPQLLGSYWGAGVLLAAIHGTTDGGESKICNVACC